MITFSVTAGKKYLEIIKYDQDKELILLNRFLRKKNEDFFWSWEYKNGMWDGFDKFIINGRYIPIGLWSEVYKICEKENIGCKLEGLEKISGFKLDEIEYKKFVEDLLKGNDIEVPRDYQYEASVKILKYKYCTAELATASGKTITLFMIMSYLKWKDYINADNKMLIIVPRIELIGQTRDKFVKDYYNRMVPINIMTVGGDDSFDVDAYKTADVVIMTYQSLKNIDEDSLKKIKHIGVDEAHTSKGKTIPDFILKCDDLMFRFGVSGTIKINEKYSTFFLIQQHIGPLVMRYSAKQLISDGFAPNVVVRMIYLNYSQVLTDDMKSYRELLKTVKNAEVKPENIGKELYTMETKLTRENETRMDFLIDLVTKFKKNTLILFNDVKNKFGYSLYERFKKTNENTFYIDGKVNTTDRADFKEVMEAENDVILVASYGTYSTGIDLKNVNYIVMAESFKAEVLIRQTIGRGMREHADKESVYIIDIVDTFGKYGKEHAKEREAIYNKQGFMVKKYEYFLK